MQVPLFLLFLQEIINKPWIVSHGNPGESAVWRAKEQRISAGRTGVRGMPAFLRDCEARHGRVQIPYKVIAGRLVGQDRR